MELVKCGGRAGPCCSNHGHEEASRGRGRFATDLELRDAAHSFDSANRCGEKVGASEIQVGSVGSCEATDSTSLAGSQADYDFDPKSVQGYQERTTFTDAVRGAGAASMQHVRQIRGLVLQRVCAQAQRVGLAPERVSAYVRHGARRAR